MSRRLSTPCPVSPIPSRMGSAFVDVTSMRVPTCIQPDKEHVSFDCDLVMLRKPVYLSESYSSGRQLPAGFTKLDRSLARSRTIYSLTTSLNRAF